MKVVVSEKAKTQLLMLNNEELKLFDEALRRKSVPPIKLLHDLDPANDYVAKFGLGDEVLLLDKWNLQAVVVGYVFNYKENRPTNKYVVLTCDDEHYVYDEDQLRAW
jgi:hypothetical protein